MSAVSAPESIISAEPPCAAISRVVVEGWKSDSPPSSSTVASSSSRRRMNPAARPSSPGLSDANVSMRPATAPSSRSRRKTGTPVRFWLARSGRFQPPLSVLTPTSAALRCRAAAAASSETIQRDR